MLVSKRPTPSLVDPTPSLCGPNGKIGEPVEYSSHWVGFALFIPFVCLHWVPNANVVSCGIWALFYHPML